MTQSGTANPNWKGGLVARSCSQCGREFLVKPNRVRRGEGKFCSRSCVSAHVGQALAVRAQARRVVKNCAVCSAEISVKPSHSKTEGRYCSRRCMAVGYTESKRGQANPNYRHGRAHTEEWRRETNRNWWRRHPELKRIRNLHRKRVLVSERDLRRLYYRQRGECALCFTKLGQSFHVDHIIPLIRGGSGTIGNVQLACPCCNTRKRSRLPADFRLRVLRKREAA